MRLRQLARKLDVDTEKVIHYLTACNLPCEDDSNAKLSEEQVELLINKYGPLEEEVDEIESEIHIDQHPVLDIPEDAIQVSEASVPAVEENETPQSETIIPPPDPAEAEPEVNTEPEVIRAPKVELTGLKVVGKIELPSPKKKEESADETTPGEPNEKPVTNRRRASTGRHQQKNKPRTTLSLAEQRKREEKIKERKKKDAEKLAKKKRRENYLKKVQSKAKEQSQKTTKEPIENTPNSKKSQKVGVIKRFFNWMRRE